MKGVASLYRTAVGKKAVMAVTGLVLFGFVLVHMFGNLKLYMGKYADGPHAGQYVIDVYGEGLRTFGAPFFGHGQFLWLARLALLAAVGFHMWSAWVVTRQSWAARPDRYAIRTYLKADYASRTMRWGGVILAFYIAFHLADLTFGVANPGFQPGQVYRNMVASFSNPLVAGLYVVANVLLGLHLYHGLWSFFQTLGWNNPKFNSWRRSFATAFAWIVTLGNVSFPLAVLMGWVR